MASVFLSYARDDKRKAEALAAALEQRGHSVWWDRSIQGGSRFSREIEQALKRSQAVVVLWSHTSVDSAWVTDEAAEGRDSGRLVPVLIEDVKPPLGFRQFQAIDLSAWKGRADGPALNGLDEAIRARCRSDHATESPANPSVRIPTRRRVPPKLAMAAVALVSIIAAGLIYWFTATPSRAGGPSMQLQLGDFTALSAEVPSSVPQTLREEILSALATDAAIVASGDKPRRKAQPGYALTGSVAKTEDALRFNVHLVNADSGTTVWTATLERPVSIADIAPRQVAVGISGVLRCGLGGAGRYRKPLPDATLSLYMNFCEEYRADGLGREPNITRALDMARRVVAAAPDFSNGWSGLAMIARVAGQGNALLDKQSLQREAARAAQRAVSLDKENSEAYQALALVQPPFAFAARERLHVKSVTVRPGDCGCEYVSYAGFLRRVGREEEALDAFQRAHDMMPLAPDVGTLLAYSLLVSGHRHEANEIASDVRKVWPGDPDLQWVLTHSAFWTGQYAEAAKALANPDVVGSDDVRAALALALKAAQSGAPAAKARAADALGNIKAKGFDQMLVITALAALGAQEKALSAAADMINRDASALGLLFEPPLAPARRSAEFAALAQRVGLVTYWRQSHHLPDFCKQADRPPLCTNL